MYRIVFDIFRLVYEPVTFNYYGDNQDYHLVFSFANRLLVFNINEPQITAPTIIESSQSVRVKNFIAVRNANVPRGTNSTEFVISPGLYLGFPV